jgi:hypothetical protein
MGKGTSGECIAQAELGKCIAQTEGGRKTKPATPPAPAPSSGNRFSLNPSALPPPMREDSMFNPALAVVPDTVAAAEPLPPPPAAAVEGPASSRSLWSWQGNDTTKGTPTNNAHHGHCPDIPQHRPSADVCDTLLHPVATPRPCVGAHA